MFSLIQEKYEKYLVRQGWRTPLASGQANHPENICSNMKEGLFVKNMNYG